VGSQFTSERKGEDPRGEGKERDRKCENWKERKVHQVALWGANKNLWDGKRLLMNEQVVANERSKGGHQILGPRGLNSPL